MSKCIVGIDPGLRGAIVVWQEDRVATFRMPIDDSGTHKRPDIQALMHVLDAFVIDLAIIEKSQAAPRQGVTSTFHYGEGYGIALACITLAAGRDQVIEVRPTTWKKDVLAAMYPHDKDGAIRFSRERYPQACLRPGGRMRVDHDGIADAVCLMHFGRSKIGT